jgi:FkbM family methyltransferase
MFQKEIKVFGKALTLNYRNNVDLTVADEVLVNRGYRLCEDSIKNAKGPIIDIGGHLGFFSLMASALRTSLPIYCFEPHIENFDLLKKNLKDNDIQNVVAKQVAVSDVVGEVELLLSREDLNHSLREAIEPTGQVQKVQATTLEKIFEKNRIQTCGLLKIDCEGSEYEILYSAPKSVFNKIDAIFLEYHEWSEKGLADALKIHLEKMGFKVKKIPNAKMDQLGYLWATKN